MVATGLTRAGRAGTDLTSADTTCSSMIGKFVVIVPVKFSTHKVVRGEVVENVMYFVRQFDRVIAGIFCFSAGAWYVFGAIFA